MPFSNIGIPGLILILIIALIIFGPAKLPELGRAFGRTLSEFKSATRGLMNGEEDDKSADKKQETLTQPKVPTTSEDSNSKSQMVTATEKAQH